MFGKSNTCAGPAFPSTSWQCLACMSCVGGSPSASRASRSFALLVQRSSMPCRPNFCCMCRSSSSTSTTKASSERVLSVTTFATLQARTTRHCLSHLACSAAYRRLMVAHKLHRSLCKTQIRPSQHMQCTRICHASHSELTTFWTHKPVIPYGARHAVTCMQAANMEEQQAHLSTAAQRSM